MALTPLTQRLSAQKPPTSVPLTPFSSIENDGKKPGKPPKQVNIFGVCTNGNQDAKLSKYLASR